MALQASINLRNPEEFVIDTLPTNQQIALAFPRGAHQEAFIEGVFRYVAQKELDWTYTIAPESLSLKIDDLIDWPGDGILTTINTPEQAELAREMSIPVVNVSSVLPQSSVPRAMVNNQAVGRMAAEHLLSRGIKSFGFYGLEDVDYSKQRWVGFCERLNEVELTCEKHLATATFNFRGKLWLEQHQLLSGWLKSLSLPCGIFAVTDYRARHLLDAAKQAGLIIPNEIAILGVDNEQIICDHVTPTISSVARNNLLEGYRAAELLDRCLNGEVLDDIDIQVPPQGVVKRQTTSAFAVSDPRLQQALEYIAEHSTSPITVDTLTAELNVSRRWLEYAFRDVLGESPYRFLQNYRLQQSKHLLTSERHIKIHAIAKQSGFSSEKQFRLSFQKAFGMTPSEYRKLNT